MIIKSLRLIAVVALLGGGFVLASNHYQNYKQIKAQAAQKATTQQESALQKANDAVNSISSKYKEVSQAYVSLQAECQKGVNAYATLSPAIRAKLPAPNCQEE